MVSSIKCSKTNLPRLAYFSKKTDVSVIDKVDSSNYSVQGSQNECENDNKFGKMFGLTTVKSLPLKEDV